MSDEIRRAQTALNQQVLGRDGVDGTAIGLLRGAPCLKVYVRDGRAGQAIPGQMNGFPVVVEVTGGFQRL